MKSLDEIQSNANESRGHELLRFHVTKLQGIEEDLVGPQQLDGFFFSMGKSHIEFFGMILGSTMT